MRFIPTRRRPRSGPLRAFRSVAVAACASVAAALAVAAVPASAEASGHGRHRTGTSYHLDCRSGNDASPGTSPGTAWRTLDRVNRQALRPGDSVLLRRGTRCDGVLQPQGSGTAAAPITLAAYGTGARPAIAGGGARAAVFLHNVQGYEIRHLDISNTPATPDGKARGGIYVLLEDYGTGRHYVVQDVKVHDVPGCDCLQPELDNAGGVLFKAAGSEKPTGFDGIDVSRTTVTTVDNIGIGTLSQWSRREPLYPAGTNSFVPITRVHVHGNRLSDIGGDGILVQNGLNPLTERNVVDGFGVRGTQAHAGILSFNSTGATFQFNEVKNGALNPPAFAYNFDAANSGSTYQYNYSHDNGAFMAFCAVPGSTSDGAVIRYNISQNDKGMKFGTFDVPVVATGCAAPQKNIQFYNNVVYSEVAPALVGGLMNTPIAYSDNTFVGRAEGSTVADPNSTFDHNLYSNVGALPPDGHAVNADPRFTRPGGGVLGYRLKCGSPAIRAGAVIPDNGGRDFFGFRVPADAPPNIGAYQGPCAKG